MGPSNSVIVQALTCRVHKHLRSPPPLATETASTQRGGSKPGRRIVISAQNMLMIRMKRIDTLNTYIYMIERLLGSV